MKKLPAAATAWPSFLEQLIWDSRNRSLGSLTLLASELLVIGKRFSEERIRQA